MILINHLFVEIRNPKIDNDFTLSTFEKVTLKTKDFVEKFRILFCLPNRHHVLDTIFRKFVRKLSFNDLRHKVSKYF